MSDDQIKMAKELLPAWFVERMMIDEWPFGLMTTTGKIIVISTIDNVHQAKDGSIWIDVILGANFTVPTNLNSKDLFTNPTDRTTASINTANIICAFELADT